MRKKRARRRLSASRALTGKASWLQSARMRDVIFAATRGAAHPAVEQVEHQRRVHADRRMQRRRRLPRAVAHGGDELADAPGRAQRHAPPVAGDHIAVRRQSRDLDLQALHRGVDVAHGAAGRALLAHHVPGLERLAQLQLDAARCELAIARKAEFEMRREPGGFAPAARRRAVRSSTSAKSCATKYGSMNRSCSSVPSAPGAPAHRACARTAPPARAAAAAAPGSCARAAAFRRRAFRAGPGARSGRPANTACRCRTRRGEYCR